ncbi:tRNA threonylcarbamoyladenosine biosynthesis protein TsaB [Pontivivens insulae]|uniref:tRNA threonylcarbamoyladenosine biosynthesis protein TsaB n=2 Tax=Pontivivens insulae TaxID=1639689 RepID=A0A2R8AES1_9RHOB|nr:tRNA threonylcarbamoyl adenosine modification protein YeaZ [Pontivivens insulae]SPF30741.1 tRNA threonylcarbamoyladenosine biosynthesis protein TsaB [Pontivivens insulae]
MARGQAERLVPLLEEVLGNAKVGWGELTAIGVCVGPGNFTGIRIAVAAARGLSLSVGVPAIGIPLLDTFVAQSGPVLALADARQDRVYAQVFRNEIPQADIELTDMKKLALAAPQPDWTVIGHRAEEAAALLSAQAWEARERVDLLRLAHLVEMRIADGRLERAAPLYVRPADAAPSSEPVPEMLD